MSAVLITGCSSGIGRATARRLALRGTWTVYATARRIDTIRDLERDGCRIMTLDVTNEASMARVVAAIEAEHGAVGVLINNAGYSQSGAVEAVPMERVRAQFETNVFGLVRLSQLVLPGMRRARSGRIVHLSSMGGKIVFPGGGFYHATKHAVEALGDAMRFELAGFGIHVVLIEPGLIRTNFGEAAGVRDVSCRGGASYACGRRVRPHGSPGRHARRRRAGDREGHSSHQTQAALHGLALGEAVHLATALARRSSVGLVHGDDLSQAGRELTSVVRN
jgi:NAD(P)-dependent dehydrogenase (short-subunit alcohol dehydrogenase family)